MQFETKELYLLILSVAAVCNSIPSLCESMFSFQLSGLCLCTWHAKCFAIINLALPIAALHHGKTAGSGQRCLNTLVTQSILCLIFFLYAKAIQRLNCSGQESKKKKFAVYDSAVPATLKQGQGHQTWNELVDPKQGYNNAKCEKPHLNNVHEIANNKVLVKPGSMSVISLEHVWKSKIVVYPWPVWCT